MWCAGNHGRMEHACVISYNTHCIDKQLGSHARRGARAQAEPVEGQPGAALQQQLPRLRIEAGRARAHHRQVALRQGAEVALNHCAARGKALILNGVPTPTGLTIQARLLTTLKRKRVGRAAR